MKLGKLPALGMVLFWAVLIAAAVGLLEGLGVIASMSWIPIALVIVGVLIGLFSISKKEAIGVMLAVLVLGIGTGVMAMLPGIGGIIEAVVEKIAAITLPAAVIVALKYIYAAVK